MEDFKNLKVWMKAQGLTVEIYQRTRNFPKEEIYGLTSQMRRRVRLERTSPKDAAGDPTLR